MPADQAAHHAIGMKRELLAAQIHAPEQGPPGIQAKLVPAGNKSHSQPLLFARKQASLFVMTLLPRLT
jgi:hypothetical protein